MKNYIRTGLVYLMFHTLVLQADPEWRSFTMDNDIFVGNDSGYSNGFYYSWISPNEGQEKRETPILISPLGWTLNHNDQLATVISGTIGQAINTPSDINIENPDDDELPYSGLLFFNQTFLSIKKNYADKLATTVGLVGPSSGAEFAQEFVHSLTGSDEPEGWGTQLEDEIVFQFSRGRIWRSWVSREDHFDLLLDSDASLGTLSSALAVGITFRYGRKLVHSYATHLLDSSRISNPVAVNRGWHFYGGLKASYVINQIFADGNTFRDSRSIDYDHDNLAISLGYSYSWDDFSMTFAINDSSIIEDESEEQLKDLTRYGALTFAWKI